MKRKRTAVLSTALGVIGLLPVSAYATNGHFAYGYGTKQKGMAGAGAALGLNALSAAANPAAMVFAGKRYDLGISLFNPNREYTVDGAPSGFPGTFGLAPGTVESGSKYFPIPSLGANWMIGDDSSFGVSVYGNGGMNTDYEPPARTFGFAPTGVDFSQLFVAPTYARKLGGKHAVGVTAILSYQRFEARGLLAFSPFSSNAADLTDNKHSNSYGYGARVGYLGEWSPYFSVGGSYQTKIKMSAFDSYAGLFAGQGDLDTPATWTAGVAIKPTDRLAFLVDVQQILYDGVASIHNPLLPNLATARLGDDTGAGFGWQNVTVVKTGVQWQSSDQWTWRAGYSHGDQPVPGSEVLFNILAPGIIEQHLTFGFTRGLGGGKEISVAVMRALSKSVSGPNPLEVPGRQTIELKMDQWEFEVGYSFGISR